ncbi:MAG: SET domain-containing protein [Bryobacteraceae bacterium]
MLHPATELRHVSRAIGWGVYATELIPKGSITWVFDDLDQIIRPARVPKLAPQLREHVHKYSYLNGRGERVLCWDHSRFINHSCRATCLSPGFDFEIAVRDILPGEELTDDYGTLNLEEEFECLCGYPECRQRIGPDDFAANGERWDRQVADGFGYIQRVRQPLWDLVREKEQIERVVSGQAKLPSCRVHDLTSGRELSRLNGTS